jgi:hypothetical protein
MRALLVALALAWLAVTGLAFEAGRRTEAEYRAAVKALEDDGITAEVERYDRGVFGSEAVTAIGPPALAPGETRTARMVLRHRIAHGPWPWSWLVHEDFDGAPVLAHVTTTPTLELEDAEVIEEVPLPLRIDALFTRADGARVRMVPDPEADFEDPELSADWGAIDGRGHFTYDGSAWSGRLSVPRLAFEGESGLLRLEDLRMELDYQRPPGPGAVPTGHARFHLGLFQVRDEDEDFTLRGLEFDGASDVAQGSWSLQVDGAYDGYDGADGRSGGGELALRIGGVAIEPLNELAPLMEVEGGDEAVKAELMMAAGALWPRLMAPGPELELSRLRVDTPDGEIRMAFRVGVDPSEPSLLSHPLTTLPAVEVDFQLSLPERILEGWLATPRPLSVEGPPAPWVMRAEMASQRVETWLERGHLERHDGAYVTSLRMRHGTVRLNGRVVSFDAL